MVHVLIRFERFTFSSHRFYRWSLTSHRHTPVPSPGATGQASPDKNSHRFAKRNQKRAESRSQPSTQSYAEPGRSGKIRRLEVEKDEERDDLDGWMIPAGLDGKKQKSEGRGREGTEDRGERIEPREGRKRNKRMVG